LSFIVSPFVCLFDITKNHIGYFWNTIITHTKTLQRKTFDLFEVKIKKTCWKDLQLKFKTKQSRR